MAAMEQTTRIVVVVTQMLVVLVAQTVVVLVEQALTPTVAAVAAVVTQLSVCVPCPGLAVHRTPGWS